MGCPTISLAVNFLPQAAVVTPVASMVRIKTILALGGSIVIGVIAYIIAICATRALQRDDVEMLPKGAKIAKFMEKYKLL